MKSIKINDKEVANDLKKITKQELQGLFGIAGQELWNRHVVDSPEGLERTKGIIALHNPRNDLEVLVTANREFIDLTSMYILNPDSPEE